MKKILSICLAAALALALCCPMALAEGTAFVVSYPEGPIKAGEEFAVTVKLTGNPGFAAVDFTIRYDEDALVCVATERGPLMKGMSVALSSPKPGNQGAVFSGATLNTVYADGVLGVAYMEAQTDLESPAFTLEKVMLYNEAGEALPFTVVAEQEAAPTPPPSVEERTEEDVEIHDTPAPEPTPAPFPDIETHWGREDIQRAVSLGLFQGYEDCLFRPDKPITRGEFVTILWRAAGEPEPQEGNPFADVAAGAFYEKPVRWAREKGYVNGKSATVFDPAAPISRQDAMKILFHMAGGQSGGEMMYFSTYDQLYRDSGDIADYARAPLYWAIYKELIAGVGDNTLAPRNSTTRAQAAKILVKYLDKYSIKEA